MMDRRKQLLEIPEAPVYYPTPEEFRDPIQYIRKIQHEAARYGICKIVPPASDWNPPRDLLPKDIPFPTKLQPVHCLQKRVGACERFLAELRHFLKYVQTTTPKKAVRDFIENGDLPMIIGARGGKYNEWERLDLHGLFTTVTALGGFHFVTYCKLWSHVAKALHYTSKVKTQLFTLYKDFLMDYALHNGHLKSNMESQFKSKRRLQICQTCTSTQNKKDLVTCEECTHQFHTFCLSNTTDTARVPWFCESCDPHRGRFFGFSPGDHFDLRAYKEFADKFKRRMVQDLPSDSIIDLECEYWKIVENADKALYVSYGSDVDTEKIDSGFPTLRNTEFLKRASPQEVEAFNKHLTSPWNLNIFPKLSGSLLGALNYEIKGITIPWLYIGMLFASFCWHVEDLYTYSVNYMHEGEGKIWYGSPGGLNAAKFEAAFKTCVPELFEMTPHILQSLVTMVCPTELIARGAQITKTFQKPGEFVLTFPQAYHGGFSTGFNYAEAVNFATVEWVPFAKASLSRGRGSARTPIFSLDELAHQLMTSTSLENCLTFAGEFELLDFLKKVVTDELERQAKLADLKTIDFIANQKQGYRNCFHCKQICHFSGVSVEDNLGKSNRIPVLCVRHALRVIRREPHRRNQLKLLRFVSKGRLHEMLESLSSMVAHEKIPFSTDSTLAEDRQSSVTVVQQTNTEKNQYALSVSTKTATENLTADQPSSEELSHKESLYKSVDPEKYSKNPETKPENGNSTEVQPPIKNVTMKPENKNSTEVQSSVKNVTHEKVLNINAPFSQSESTEKQPKNNQGENNFDEQVESLVGENANIKNPEHLIRSRMQLIGSSSAPTLHDGNLSEIPQETLKRKHDVVKDDHGTKRIAVVSTKEPKEDHQDKLNGRTNGKEDEWYSKGRQRAITIIRAVKEDHQEISKEKNATEEDDHGTKKIVETSVENMKKDHQETLNGKNATAKDGHGAKDIAVTPVEDSDPKEDQETSKKKICAEMDDLGETIVVDPLEELKEDHFQRPDLQFRVKEFQLT